MGLNHVHIENYKDLLLQLYYGRKVDHHCIDPFLLFLFLIARYFLLHIINLIAILFFKYECIFILLRFVAQLVLARNRNPYANHVRISVFDSPIFFSHFLSHGSGIDSLSQRTELTRNLQEAKGLLVNPTLFQKYCIKVRCP